MSKLAVNLRLQVVALVLGGCLASCTSDTNTAPPPPPPLPTPPVAPAAPSLDPAPAPEAPVEGKASAEHGDAKASTKQGSRGSDEVKEHDTGESLYDLVKEGKATLPVTKPSPGNGKAASSPIAKPEPKPPEPTKPEPTKPEPQKPVAKVNIPSTANVRIDVPRGMQDLLNKDPRMAPWVKQVVEIADKCYAEERKTNALAEGSIAVNVIMHENDRPDADVKSLPPQLSGVVACATGKLMRIKMPLFTGPEGQKHSVKIVFSK